MITDEPIVAAPNARRASAAPGSLGRQGGFGPSMAYGMDPSTFSSPGAYNTWGGPPNPFGTGSLPGSGYMSGWANSTPSGFGGVGGMPTRPSQPRSVAVRLMLCRACKILEGSSHRITFMPSRPCASKSTVSTLVTSQCLRRNCSICAKQEGKPHQRRRLLRRAQRRWTSLDSL